MGTWVSGLKINISNLEQAEKHSKDLLKEVRAHQGDGEILIEYLQLAHGENTLVSESESQIFVDKLVKDLPERKKKKDLLVIEEKTKFVQIQMRYEPAYDYILQQFDQRIKLLQAKGIKIKYKEKQEALFSHPSENGRGVTNLRTVSILGADPLLIDLIPAVVQSGSISEPSLLYINVKERMHGNVAVILFEENSYSIESRNHHMYPGVNKVTSGKGSPLKDQKFKEQIRIIMNLIFSKAVINKSNN